MVYSYDNANQLTGQTDRDGRRTTFSYDSGGRRTGETWVGASPSETVTYTYDNANALTGVTDANATLTFTYDSGGRQITAATNSHDSRCLSPDPMKMGNLGGLASFAGGYFQRKPRSGPT